MSTSTSAVQNGQPSGGSSLLTTFAPVLAATAALAPAVHGLQVRADQQLERSVSRFSFSGSLVGALKGGPLVGVQLMVQNAIETRVRERTQGVSNAVRVAGSSALASVVTSPLLAAFNAVASKQNVWKALRSLSRVQVGCLVLREWCFLGSQAAVNPVSAAMRRNLGDTPAVNHAAAFVSGAVGSLAGHPADTAFTRSQHNLPTLNRRQAMLGAPVKAVAVGLFSVLYPVALKYSK